MKKIAVFLLSITIFTLSAQSALDFYNSGKKLQNAQDWAGAVEQYQEALQKNSSYADVWFSLSECSYAMGEYALALNYIENASKFLKNSSALQNLKGFSLIGLGRLDEARLMFLSVLASFPNDVDARFGLAELDIFNGKISGAEKYYKDALSRQTQNKKALLSLALLSWELGNSDSSKEYINQALKYHNSESEVHYFASYLAVKDNNLAEAEQYCRNAVHLAPRNAKFLELLSLILYSREKYTEAMSLCDQRISLDRNTPLAWYLKAKLFEKQGRVEDALISYKTGLEVNPTDEVMRTALENLINNTVDIEDTRRSSWAQYHIREAQDAMSLYLSDRASYEFKRSLRINPLDSSTRLLYADLLLQNKQHEAYLSQLKFIQQQGSITINTSDIIESYESLLSNSIPSKWNIDPLYLDKTRYSIGLFYTEEKVQLLHPDSLPVTVQLVRESFESEGFFNVTEYLSPVSGYASAFRYARNAGYDYFGLIQFEETERDLSLVLTLYSAKTGTKAQTYSIYRTGNGRYSQAVQKLVKSVTSDFDIKGTIISRSLSTALIDLGRNDGVELDSVYSIIQQGTLKVLDSGIGLSWDDENILGTLTITNVGEDVSEAKVKHSGFYDRINVSDEIVFIKPVEEDSENKGETVLNENTPTQVVRTPVLIDLLKTIK